MLNQAFNPEREFAFPDCPNLPAEAFQFGRGSGVAFDVTIDLHTPEMTVRFGRGALSATVPMPKASVNKDNKAIAREDYIGPARQIGAMQPEPKSAGMKCATHCHLGPSVLRFHAAHHLRARFGIPAINHNGRMAALGSIGNG
jgi:hypothetical protein